MKFGLLLFTFLFLFGIGYSQNYSFDFNSSGKRVCLVQSSVDTAAPSVTIQLLDAASNTSVPVSIFRRPFHGTSWTSVATNLPSGTASWVDHNVNIGEQWEYQIKRLGTWTFNSNTYDATGYTIGSVLFDNSVGQGQMILLVARNIIDSLPEKYTRLKKELTAEGWFVNELVVNRAGSWDSGDTVVSIKSQIKTIYNNAPANDKPKCIFILGHVPLPRSGSTTVTAPDAHDQNKGARGCDAYYADMDGIYTDTATFNPGGLSSDLAINLPGDFKWDQDFFPSDIEMAFGRIDFADLTDYSLTEIKMTENYLDRLSNYKNVNPGFNMGEKSAFFYGFTNSNDGSYRSLPSISKSINVFENTVGAPHPQWVKDNGPFKIYMQNLTVPLTTEWDTLGMNATVFTSDQSYWGYGDVPQNYIYSRIRSLLAADSKCLITLWTTTGLNIFHQAGTGEAFGIAVKEIMNHNSTNQLLEKAPQNYDTEDWWNRTHFAFYGDPTVRLFQVAPPSGLSLADSNGYAAMRWTASPNPEVVGYHVYESNSEFGVFARITGSPVLNTGYILSNYHFGNWYMVKAVKIQESGCGMFLNPSIGISVQGNIPEGISRYTSSGDFLVSPNPATERITIEVSHLSEGANVAIYNVNGQQVMEIKRSGTKTQLDVSTLPAGFYVIKVVDKDRVYSGKIVKE